MIQVTGHNQCWVKNKLNTIKEGVVIVTFKDKRNVAYANPESILLSKDVVESIKFNNAEYCFDDTISGFIAIRKKLKSSTFCN